MSGLTTLTLVLLTYLSFFALCGETQEVTVETGADITLQCQGPRDRSIKMIAWSRSDLKSGDFVFYFRDNRTYKNYQHESFHGRVELRDPEMKNGDVSVILKNVTVNDTGTYECDVEGISRENEGQKGFRQSVILKVTESETQEVTAKTGEDVTLQCQGPRDANIIMIAWSRADLKSDDYVFYFRDNKLHESYQHPSFRGRVELRDPDMKNRHASVILKNVNINDAGTYECDVEGISRENEGQKGFRQSVILKVTESETQEVTAKTGEDVTLQCQGPRDANIIMIAWSRADLKSDDYVFYFRDNKLHESYQHPSFRGRVELRDPDMKNRDASVILKNVNINDAGTYECVVLTGSSGMIETQAGLRQSVTLKVTESGHTAGNAEEGGDEERGDKGRGNLTAPLIAVAVVICVVGLVFVLWKCRTSLRRNPEPPAAAQAAALQTL